MIERLLTGGIYNSLHPAIPSIVTGNDVRTSTNDKFYSKGCSVDKDPRPWLSTRNGTNE